MACSRELLGGVINVSGSSNDVLKRFEAVLAASNLTVGLTVNSA
jgi:hypothetical protein